MPMQSRIEEKISQAFQPQHLELINESHHHNVKPGSESHFKLVLVTSSFSDMTLVQRHRAVYDTLQAELRDGVHALTLQLFTPEEWASRGQVQKSPPCLGGSGK